MGLFNGFLSHPTEVSLKQISLEYGLILVEGEFVEKAYKLAADKFILTNKRLILICQTKNSRVEYTTIPYSSIRKFSKESKGLLDEDADLKIWLKDETLAIRKEFKGCSGINEIYQILSKYTL
ncbi:PH domain-containing protein [Paradesertivirga mongoliensis]|uniref:PH domain-containing protein n=1 Tax=Paradesertivirga mongoliensis TaxID=2100740 RepID=A0ABW4ZN13_9SPHI|nr:PH domain-containing protein [Pedobacter mongoliensis]